MRGHAAWSEAEIRMLHQLSAKGISCARIAEAMAKVFPVSRSWTRNMVLAQRHRLGLTDQTRAQRRAKLGSQDPARVATRLKQRRAAAAPASPPELTRAPTALHEVFGPPPADALALDALHARACRWPFDGPGGETVYCGRKRTHGPYCAEHHARGVQRAPQNQEAA